nr:hypothetical protein [Thiocapsa sp. KS1]
MNASRSQDSRRAVYSRILYFTTCHEDYLSNGLLHGLRNLSEHETVDFPKQDILYRNCPEYIRHQIRGCGFTLYTDLLDDLEIDRSRISEDISKGLFDLIIISDIWRQFGYFVRFRPWMNRKNTIILDGADACLPYPAAGLFWRRPYYWFLPRAHREFLYFKREWTSDTRFTPLTRVLTKGLRRRLPTAATLRRISFSIPESKIILSRPHKEKDFPKHIVDAEVAERVQGAATSYAFSSEAEYYADLQSARFGITTKRSGWDCLRHYEIAANASVPCFRDLQLKPDTCAPHGLNDSNCIIYRSADELFRRIGLMTDTEYTALQDGALAWVRSHTTKTIAQYVLSEHRRFVDGT